MHIFWFLLNKFVSRTVA